MTGSRIGWCPARRRSAPAPGRAGTAPCCPARWACRRRARPCSSGWRASTPPRTTSCGSWRRTTCRATAPRTCRPRPVAWRWRPATPRRRPSCRATRWWAPGARPSTCWWPWTSPAPCSPWRSPRTARCLPPRRCGPWRATCRAAAPRWRRQGRPRGACWWACRRRGSTTCTSWLRTWSARRTTSVRGRCPTCRPRRRGSPPSPRRTSPPRRSRPRRRR
mmetsp:Transcript_1032/g.3345  ORF Transcript_1032/g.3345 Transcript_1032/m.3345 type:complete len:219 (-) Transcript_1032:180-836(-)